MVNVTIHLSSDFRALRFRICKQESKERKTFCESGSTPEMMKTSRHHQSEQQQPADNFSCALFFPPQKIHSPFW